MVHSRDPFCICNHPTSIPALLNLCLASSHAGTSANSTLAHPYLSSSLHINNSSRSLRYASSFYLKSTRGFSPTVSSLPCLSFCLPSLICRSHLLSALHMPPAILWMGTEALRFGIVHLFLCAYVHACRQAFCDWLSID